MDALEKSVHKRIDKLQGSINYVSRCVEDFNENFASIMNVVRDNQVKAVADSLPFEASFPLTSEEEVNDYIEKDPQAIKLTERLVRPKSRGLQQLSYAMFPFPKPTIFRLRYTATCTRFNTRLYNLNKLQCFSNSFYIGGFAMNVQGYVIPSFFEAYCLTIFPLFLSVEKALQTPRFPYSPPHHFSQTYLPIHPAPFTKLFVQRDASSARR